jgi:hypothetical protein
MGLGIILSALSAGGNSMAQSIDEQQKADIAAKLTQQRADLEEQKAKSISMFNNQQAVDTANQQRSAQAGRLAPTQDQIQGIIASNAQGPNGGSDYTTDTDNTPAKFGEMDTADQTAAAYQPSQKQLVGLQIQNATAAGDFTAAEALTKMADAGKVSVAYGGKVVDQNDIDPVTGDPRVVVDNSVGRDTAAAARNANGAAQAEAHMTAAKAAQARAANGPGGGGARTDQQLNLLIHQGSQLTTQLKIAQNAADNARPADRPALLADIASIKDQIKATSEKAAARSLEISKIPVVGTGGAAGSPAGAAPSGTDFSGLW